MPFELRKCSECQTEFTARDARQFTCGSAHCCRVRKLRLDNKRRCRKPPDPWPHLTVKECVALAKKGKLPGAKFITASDSDSTQRSHRVLAESDAFEPYDWMENILHFRAGGGRF